MTSTFVLLAMIFCHILDDFVLQSAFLADGKQRSWWQINAPDKRYRNDYMACLFMHAFSWSFMIHLPLAIYLKFHVGYPFLVSVMVNQIIHANIDNLKANMKKLNLVEDQLLHIVQIIITFLLIIYIRIVR